MIFLCYFQGNRLDKLLLTHWQKFTFNPRYKTQLLSVFFFSLLKSHLQAQKKEKGYYSVYKLLYQRCLIARNSYLGQLITNGDNHAEFGSSDFPLCSDMNVVFYVVTPIGIILCDT